ncbi:F-box domain-containing protein [Mycena kentingensis (nom. inval.)]|nr:F-box domain-containing protein [Mycena kentingensis (nom. inval.)]
MRAGSPLRCLPSLLFATLSRALIFTLPSTTLTPGTITLVYASEASDPAGNMTFWYGHTSGAGGFFRAQSSVAPTVVGTRASLQVDITESPVDSDQWNFAAGPLSNFPSGIFAGSSPFSIVAAPGAGGSASASQPTSQSATVPSLSTSQPASEQPIAPGSSTSAAATTASSDPALTGDPASASVPSSTSRSSIPPSSSSFPSTAGDSSNSNSTNTSASPGFVGATKSSSSPSHRPHRRRRAWRQRLDRDLEKYSIDGDSVSQPSYYGSSGTGGAQPSKDAGYAGGSMNSSSNTFGYGSGAYGQQQPPYYPTARQSNPYADYAPSSDAYSTYPTAPSRYNTTAPPPSLAGAGGAPPPPLSKAARERQAYLTNQLAAVHAQLAALSLPQEEEESAYGGISVSASPSDGLRNGNSNGNWNGDANGDGDGLREQNAALSARIRELEGQLRSQWALGLSDEPPPGYRE